MKRISIALTIIGIALLVYSFSLDTYTNTEAYNEAYLLIDREKVGRKESFKLFYSLRDEYLTHK